MHACAHTTTPIHPRHCSSHTTPQGSEERNKTNGLNSRSRTTAPIRTRMHAANSVDAHIHSSVHYIYFTYLDQYPSSHLTKCAPHPRPALVCITLVTKVHARTRIAPHDAVHVCVRTPNLRPRHRFGQRCLTFSRWRLAQVGEIHGGYDITSYTTTCF
ncbi:hypothetical protein OG21DRAFT_1607671 [Imleria badia]|nr:hypothetical protein OG21DRAFT_1607671 [Imleria badia]